MPMAKYKSISIAGLLLLSASSFASGPDQIKAGSLVCDSSHSYNEIIVIEIENKLAKAKGLPGKPNPKDCRVIKNSLAVTLDRYSGGSAVVREGEKTLFTSKSNVVPGKIASAKESSLDQCRKKVLGAYCLGGSIKALPKPDLRDGDIFVYADGKKRIYIESVHERIASVSIFYPSPSWLNYRLLLGQLQEKYGKGVNLDKFPDYAQSDSSKATTISLNKGRALTLWPQEGWSINYGWASRNWRILEYRHDKLSDILDKKRV